MCDKKISEQTILRMSELLETLYKRVEFLTTAVTDHAGMTNTVFKQLDTRIKDLEERGEGDDQTNHPQHLQNLQRQ